MGSIPASAAPPGALHEAPLVDVKYLRFLDVLYSTRRLSHTAASTLGSEMVCQKAVQPISPALAAIMAKGSTTSSDMDYETDQCVVG